MTEMELKRIRVELDKLTALISGWRSGAEIPAIERELVLGKLRELYDAVYFPCIAAEITGGIAPVQSEIVTEEVLSIDLDEVLSLGMVAETKPEPEAPAVSVEQTPVAAEPEAPAVSVEQTPVVAEPEAPAVSVEQTPVAAEPESHPQPEAAATLFELEDETEQHRRKQRVIMSLYGSSEPTPAPSPISSKPIASPQKPMEPAPVKTEFDEDFEELSVKTVRLAPALATAPTDESFEAEPHHEIPDPDSDNDAPLFSGEEADKGQATVLGDVINYHRQTLADTFTPRRDTLSEAAHHAPVRDLRAAIGINDRFLLVRDLFEGDARACDATLDVLNGFDNLDDCMIHIAENYTWNPNSDGVKFLMELLERKYL